MRTVILVRDKSELSGTFSVITAGMLQIYGGEPPWKDNKKNLSCIPPAPGERKEYRVVPHESPKHGKCFKIVDVDGRDEVLWHKGNFCGDIERGLKSDTEACVIVGNAIGEIAGQRALLASRDAWERFTAEMEWEPFKLVISWDPKSFHE